MAHTGSDVFQLNPWYTTSNVSTWGGAKRGGSGVFDLPDLTFSDANKVCVPWDGDSFRVNTFGLFAGEVPFFYPLTHFMIQLVVLIFLSRSLQLLLRPLRQPRIVCDMIVGILLGANVLGAVLRWLNWSIDDARDGSVQDAYVILYDIQDSNVPRTVATAGLMFYLFLIGVKMEPKMLLQSGRKAWVISVSSALAPFLVVLTVFLCSDLKTRLISTRYVAFLVATCTITAFPNLADLLNEIQLLNSELGRLAISCAMVHGIFGFGFMALFTAVNQATDSKDSVGIHVSAGMQVFWTLTLLVAMLLVIVFPFRRWVLGIARRTPKGAQVGDLHILAILLSVIAMGFVSDMIGASFVTGPLIMGLVIPEGPPLGATLVKKAELIATEIMLPILFITAGNYVDPKLFRSEMTGLILKLVGTLIAGYLVKLLATLVSAYYCNVSMHKAFMLGLILNFKGIIELITLLNFKNGSILGNVGYTGTVIASLLMTAVAVPIVSMCYKPFSGDDYFFGRRTIEQLKPDALLSLMVCIHNDAPITAIINLLEASCTTTAAGSSLCVYVLHLVDLAGRSASALIAHKNKKGFINPSQMDTLHNAFINYEQQKNGAVLVKPYTAIAPYKTMHQDVCSLAGEVNVNIIIVPFPVKAGAELSDADQGIRHNVATILDQAPCSVGLLISKGKVGAAIPSSTGYFQHHIGVIFWGGSDDREALACAARAAQRTGVSLTVLHFVLAGDRRGVMEKQMDEELLGLLRIDLASNKELVVDDVEVKDLVEAITMLRSRTDMYDLLVVGRKQGPNLQSMEEEMSEWSENPELGFVGDMLASSDFSFFHSLLVVQQ